jgi:hypothetical protein
MQVLRRLATTVMSTGRISRGWYSLLTGVAMLYVAWLLGSVHATDDAAPFVGLVLGITGIGCLGRGILLEVRRHRSD